MTEARNLTAKVEAAFKRADSDVIVERTFFDEVSDRLYITIVKGPRKTEIVLTGSERDQSDQKKIEHLVEQCLLRLEHTPIG